MMIKNSSRVASALFLAICPNPPKKNLLCKIVYAVRGTVNDIIADSFISILATETKCNCPGKEKCSHLSFRFGQIKLWITKPNKNISILTLLFFIFFLHYYCESSCTLPTVHCAI